MKNNLSRKLLATILSLAMMLNSGAAAFAAESGVDGAPIVTASETGSATEATSSVDETTPPTEDAATDSGEQGGL